VVPLLPATSFWKEAFSMTACILFICLGIPSVFLFLLEKNRASSVRTTLFKTLSSLFFVCTALCAWQASGSSGLFGVFLTAGLVCGMLGDIWLDLKNVFPRENTFFTYAGFIFFGTGHILFVSGLIFCYGQKDRAAFAWVPLVLALVLCAVLMLQEKRMSLHYGDMKVMCAVYAFLLLSTVCVSASLTLMHGFRVVTLDLIFVGSLLFLLSDLILSQSYFGRGHDRTVDLVSNIVTYYLAQYILAFSLFFL